MKPASQLASIAALLFCGSTQAADLTVDVLTTAGRPMANAVVSLYGSSGAQPAAALSHSGPYQMSQENIEFHPFVLLAPVGATVSFPNFDSVRHHVYSFSPAKKFELKLFGREEHRTVTFDRPGVVAVGCNIHDRMSAYIYVTDTPYVAKSDSHGRVVIHNAPDGAVSMKIWQPYLKAPGQTSVRSLTLQGAERVEVRLDIRDPGPGMTGKGS
jgi:plastocyanin